MTAINWWLQPEGVVIVSDSLMGCVPPGVPRTEVVPAAFVQKVFPVPHLDAVISGRGDSDIIVAWVNRAATRVLARDFDVLCDLAPDLIRKTVQECNDGRDFDFDGTTSIFMWGWSARAGRFVGFSYRSPKNYVPEPMGYGVVFAPMFDAERPDIKEAMGGEQTPIALVKAMQQQHLEHPADVGGDVMIMTMTKPSDEEIEYSARRLFRFENYEDDYEAALTPIESQSS